MRKWSEAWGWLPHPVFLSLWSCSQFIKRVSSNFQVGWLPRSEKKNDNHKTNHSDEIRAGSSLVDGSSSLSPAGACWDDIFMRDRLGWLSKRLGKGEPFGRWHRYSKKWKKYLKGLLKSGTTFLGISTQTVFNGFDCISFKFMSWLQPNATATITLNWWSLTIQLVVSTCRDVLCRVGLHKPAFFHCLSTGFCCFNTDCVHYFSLGVSSRSH